MTKYSSISHRHLRQRHRIERRKTRTSSCGKTLGPFTVVHAAVDRVTFEQEVIQETVYLERLTESPEQDTATKLLEIPYHFCTEVEKVYEQQTILPPEVAGQTVSCYES